MNKKNIMVRLPASVFELVEMAATQSFRSKGSQALYYIIEGLKKDGFAANILDLSDEEEPTSFVGVGTLDD